MEKNLTARDVAESEYAVSPKISRGLFLGFCIVIFMLLFLCRAYIFPLMKSKPYRDLRCRREVTGVNLNSRPESIERVGKLELENCFETEPETVNKKSEPVLVPKIVPNFPKKPRLTRESSFEKQIP